MPDSKLGRERAMPSDLDLRLPAEHEEEEFLRAHRATSPTVPYFLHFYSEGMPFRQYLDVLREQQRGVGLPPDRVPSSFLFGFIQGRIVGRVSIRHALNARFERVGGHVGYVVVPEFRRRGYATQMLARSLRIARDELGIRRALLTCDDDNLGSIRTIEKNGGVFESVISAPELQKPKRRYWIETASA